MTEPKRESGVCECGHVRDNHAYGEIRGAQIGGCMERCDCDEFSPQDTKEDWKLSKTPRFQRGGSSLEVVPHQSHQESGWEAEFDRKWDAEFSTGGARRYFYQHQEIKSFISQLLTSVRKAERDILRGKLEKLRIENPVCYCKTHPEHNCGVTSNEAIDDALQALDQ